MKSHKTEGGQRVPKALVIEFGRWNHEGVNQALGLLEIRQSAPALKAFRRIFKQLNNSREVASMSDLSAQRERFLRESSHSFEDALKKEAVARMGFCDVLTRYPHSDHCEVQYYGGGFIAQRTDVQPDHIHIFPHGGTCLQLMDDKGHRMDDKGHKLDLERFIREGLWSGTRARAILDGYDPGLTFRTSQGRYLGNFLSFSWGRAQIP